ncbi:MAG: phosphoglycerate kinase, partial [Bacteroidales bacterium]|nr:phosphoglycerate kinase [Bacteroidales bacterium]
MKKNIDQFNLKGKKVLVRVDFNVPLNDKFQVTDDTRIRAAIPTIEKILAVGGAVILMSHLGRPKEGPEDRFSLKHLLPVLEKKLGQKPLFANDCVGDEAIEKAAALKPGQVLLLENLRFHKEETKGDEAFAKKLALLADAYVNDAFGTAHRAHASTAIIAKFFPGARLFGYLMQDEVSNLEKVTKNPSQPFTAVLGGAKVSGKIEIINKLIDKVDNLVIGGGMMFTFIKAMGGKVGSSLVEEDLVETAGKAIEKAKAKGVKLL